MGKLAGKKVFITGSTGFVGSNLVRRSVKEGADVHILTRKKSNEWRLNDVLDDTNTYKADLTDIKELNLIIRDVEPSIIFHLATYGGDPSQHDTQKIIESNLIGTVNLVKACKEVGFDNFINTSSSSEYGIKSKPMYENNLLEPVNDYGVSKAAATLFCQSIAKKYNLPITTLRLFSPYGYFEGEKRLIPSVILTSLKGESPKVSSPHFVRDFVFIEDVLDSYLKIIESPQVMGEIFNIGTGKQHTVGEVVNKIIELTGEKVQPEWGLTSKWSNEPKKWQADISKANKYLKWTPKYSLERGLAKTVEWFSDYNGLYE
ncbi:MAG: NAD-dependent epimerase/dehydratase family protein [Methanobacterium sp.]